jgi:hypothetical protein
LGVAVYLTVLEDGRMPDTMNVGAKMSNRMKQFPDVGVQGRAARSSGPEIDCFLVEYESHVAPVNAGISTRRQC